MYFNEVKYWEIKRSSNKKEFKVDTIRFTFVRKDCFAFQHIRFDTFNNCEVQIELANSFWEILKSGLKHTTGKKWYPDGEHQDIIFEMIGCLFSGQLGPTAANLWVTEFFAHLEVDTLGQDSIFNDDFPEFFRTNSGGIKRVRDKIVKSTMET